MSESCCRTGSESHLISGNESHRSDIHQADLSVPDPLDIIINLVRTVAEEKYSKNSLALERSPNSHYLRYVITPYEGYH
jgi:hypothetical protein